MNKYPDTTRNIPPSELIINEDGSIFHLRLKPGQIAEKVLLVGDPARVELVASFFDSIECDVQNREFRTITGTFQGKRITVLSHGIGPDNIDIVLTELDALVNIDFSTRTVKETLTSLSLVRVGTSGALQTNCPVGSFVVSTRSVGFDGVLNYYEGRSLVTDQDFEQELCKQIHWSRLHCTPYAVSADKELVERIGYDMIHGTTISANGFYAPQGRWVRIEPLQKDINTLIEAFEYRGEKITNYEMESAPLAGLSLLMGHRAMTVCVIIANRKSHQAMTDYHETVKQLINNVLERI